MTRKTCISFYSPGIIFNFDQYGNSFFQDFLLSDPAGWDNSPQKFKNTNNLAVLIILVL